MKIATFLILIVLVQNQIHAQGQNQGATASEVRSTIKLDPQAPYTYLKDTEKIKRLSKELAKRWKFFETYKSTLDQKDARTRELWGVTGDSAAESLDLTKSKPLIKKILKKTIEKGTEEFEESFSETAERMASEREGLIIEDLASFLNSKPITREEKEAVLLRMGLDIPELQDSKLFLKALEEIGYEKIKEEFDNKDYWNQGTSQEDPLTKIANTEAELTAFKISMEKSLQTVMGLYAEQQKVINELVSDVVKNEEEIKKNAKLIKEHEKRIGKLEDQTNLNTESINELYKLGDRNRKLTAKNSASIEVLNSYMRGKLDPKEKLYALRSGELGYSGLSPADSLDLDNKLNRVIFTQDTKKAMKNAMVAIEILSKLGLFDGNEKAYSNIKKTHKVIESGINVFLNPNIGTILESINTIISIFSSPTPDPVQARFDEIEETLTTMEFNNNERYKSIMTAIEGLGIQMENLTEIVTVNFEQVFHQIEVVNSNIIASIEMMQDFREETYNQNLRIIESLEEIKNMVDYSNDLDRLISLNEISVCNTDFETFDRNNIVEDHCLEGLFLFTSKLESIIKRFYSDDSNENEIYNANKDFLFEFMLMKNNSFSNLKISESANGVNNIYSLDINDEIYSNNLLPLITNAVHSSNPQYFYQDSSIVHFKLDTTSLTLSNEKIVNSELIELLSNFTFSNYTPDESVLEALLNHELIDASLWENYVSKYLLTHLQLELSNETDFSDYHDINNIPVPTITRYNNQITNLEFLYHYTTLVIAQQSLLSGQSILQHLNASLMNPGIDRSDEKDRIRAQLAFNIIKDNPILRWNFFIHRYNYLLRNSELKLTREFFDYLIDVSNDKKYILKRDFYRDMKLLSGNIVSEFEKPIDYEKKEYWQSSPLFDANFGFRPVFFNAYKAYQDNKSILDIKFKIDARAEESSSDPSSIDPPSAIDVSSSVGRIDIPSVKNLIPGWNNDIDLIYKKLKKTGKEIDELNEYDIYLDNIVSYFYLDSIDFQTSELSKHTLGTNKTGEYYVFDRPEFVNYPKAPSKQPIGDIIAIIENSDELTVQDELIYARNSNDDNYIIGSIITEIGSRGFKPLAEYKSDDINNSADFFVEGTYENRTGHYGVFTQAPHLGKLVFYKNDPVSPEVIWSGSLSGWNFLKVPNSQNFYGIKSNTFTKFNKLYPNNSHNPILNTSRNNNATSIDGRCLSGATFRKIYMNYHNQLSMFEYNTNNGNYRHHNLDNGFFHNGRIKENLIIDLVHNSGEYWAFDKVEKNFLKGEIHGEIFNDPTPIEFNYYSPLYVAKMDNYDKFLEEAIDVEGFKIEEINGEKYIFVKRTDSTWEVREINSFTKNEKTLHKDDKEEYRILKDQFIDSMRRYTPLWHYDDNPEWSPEEKIIAKEMFLRSKQGEKDRKISNGIYRYTHPTLDELTNSTIYYTFPVGNLLKLRNAILDKIDDLTTNNKMIEILGVTEENKELVKNIYLDRIVIENK